MKKLLPLFLSIILIFTLTACGSSNNEQNNDSESNISTVESSELSENVTQAENTTPTASTAPTASNAPSVSTALAASNVPSVSTAPSANAAPSASIAPPKSTAQPTNAAPTATAASSATDEEPETTKILVAYFSYSGNTRTVANKIHDQVGGDIFEIKTTYEYPTGYNDVLDQAQQEKKENARPKLNAQVKNMSDYDIVFIGYPIWWGDMPMAVYSFLDEYDLSGKTIIPFCTHGGSGFSNTVSSIKKAESGATVSDGLAIRDSNVNKADDDITKWLKNLGVID